MATEEKNETMYAVWQYTIELVAAVINNTAPPEKKDFITWEDVTEFAKRHRILNIIAYAVDGMKNLPDEKTLSFFEEFRQSRIMIEAQQELETIAVMDKLEKMNIRHMPLKGFIVKNYYPSPDMRTMSDIDMLVEKDRLDDILNEFSKDGFSFQGSGDLHANMKRGNVYIEFHHNMVNESYGVMYPYFADGFARAKKTDGYEFRYELSQEDMYIFLLAHLAKHYSYGGTGIRTILDLYVYRKALPCMDMEYVKAQAAQIGLSVFKERMEELADSWFSGHFDGEFGNVAEYICSGGVYGKKDNILKNNFILNTEKQELQDKKKKNIISILFPEYDIMVIRYPVLKKQKWLLPLFWIVRVFDTLIHNPKNAKNRLNDSAKIMKIDDESIDVQRNAGIDKL